MPKPKQPAKYRDFPESYNPHHSLRDALYQHSRRYGVRQTWGEDEIGRNFFRSLKEARNYLIRGGRQAQTTKAVIWDRYTEEIISEQ